MLYIKMYSKGVTISAKGHCPLALLDNGDVLAFARMNRRKVPIVSSLFRACTRACLPEGRYYVSVSSGFCSAGLLDNGQVVLWRNMRSQNYDMANLPEGRRCISVSAYVILCSK